MHILWRSHEWNRTYKTVRTNMCADMCADKHTNIVTAHKSWYCFVWGCNFQFDKLLKILYSQSSRTTIALWRQICIFYFTTYRTKREWKMWQNSKCTSFRSSARAKQNNCCVFNLLGVSLAFMCIYAVVKMRVSEH